MAKDTGNEIDSKDFKKECIYLFDNFKYCLEGDLDISYFSILHDLYDYIDYKDTKLTKEIVNSEITEKIFPNIINKNGKNILESEFNRLFGSLKIKNNKKNLKFLNTLNRTIKEIMQKEENIKNKQEINGIYSMIKENCEDITMDDINEIIKSKGYENHKTMDLLNLVLKEQEKINNTPDITKDRFFEKYPDFHSALDNELIDLSFENYELLKRYNLNGMYYKDYFIYFDELFLFQGINKSFLDQFLYFVNKTKEKGIFKIRLNFDKIVSLEKYKQIIYVEGFFRGPYYNPNNLFIFKNEFPQVSIRKRYNQKFSELFKNDIIQTEFLLDQKNNAIQIEEVGKNELDGFYMNRFFHSEFNIEEKNIKHFDGAIFSYDIDTYQQRENTDISKNIRLNKDKIKLFQVNDCEISIEDREELLLGYYNQNEMVLEYLDLESYKEYYKSILDYDNGIDF